MNTYRSALVLGMGKSGQWAARLLRSEGVQVLILDRAKNEKLEAAARELESTGVQVMLGVESPASVLQADGAWDVCVLSPGISAGSEWVRMIEARNIPVIAELELGASRCACPIVAITGSNGKSTLVKLCFDLLVAAGRRTGIAGNYGIPLCEVVSRREPLDWMVVEVSSFQLERVKEFRPRVAVLLNVQANHLDRHGTLEEYMATKARIFSCMAMDDKAILAFDLVARLRDLGGRQRDWITFGNDAHSQWQYQAGLVRCSKGAISIAGTMFDNEILGPSAAAAAGVLQACGEDPFLLGPVAAQFQALPHRMQEVDVLGGVTFVNNSKATTLAAVSASLRMARGPVRLLAGGLLKEHDLTCVKKVLAEKAKAVYLFGRDAQRIGSVWQESVSCHIHEDLTSAFAHARKEAVAGETVLLAPGCTSFDQYRNFEERGEHFARLVKALKEGE